MFGKEDQDMIAEWNGVEEKGKRKTGFAPSFSGHNKDGGWKMVRR